MIAPHQLKISNLPVRRTPDRQKNYCKFCNSSRLISEIQFWTRRQSVYITDLNLAYQITLMPQLNQKFKITCLILSVYLALTACKKNSDNPQTPTDDTIYTSACQAGELIWLTDNTTVLINDHCGANIYILNTVTKTTKSWNYTPNFLLQRFYYIKDIPGKIFFTTMTKQPSGAFGTPFKLYSLGVDNLDTILVKGNITDNTYAMGFVGGGKKMVLKTTTDTSLVDLETGSSQSIHVSAEAQAFSPDNTKILFYPYNTIPITGASTFDLNCSCTQPITLAGNGKAVWRTSAIMSYASSGLPAILQFMNLQTGSVIKSFPDAIAGPWISAGSNLAFLFVKGPTWSTDFDGILISYDFISNQTRELAHAKSNPASSFVQGIFIAVQSPDGTKLVYALDGNKLKVISL